ncbi:sialate O-acetylesterase [Paraglaciecola sp. L3A3]|uniref:sialate O-acetylesterase n=1 Tax=Paraglaciecola sp. L3A3 TaxID=2686358 RepID=UPI0018EEF029|nr:sialate O-acetylesterase [Paraglaciecola sp. L3A3]
MQNKIIQLLTIFVFSFSFSGAVNSAESSTDKSLQVASIFTDHMVLQRDLPISVWGKSPAGSKVSVAFSNQKQMTISDNNGDWKLQLSPLKGSFTPESMTISSSHNQIIILDDIVVGEVWIASGQSNMQMMINSIKEIKELRKTAKHIRSFTVERTVSFKEETSMQGSWQADIPDSAIAFSFAYFLQQRAEVPVGIILTAWGSSSLEAWMPRDLTSELPYFATIMKEFDSNPHRIGYIDSILSQPNPWSKKDDVYLRRQPNILFNAMMKPIAPYTVRGLVWYQGERNTQSMDGLVSTPWFKNNSGMLKYKEALQAWIKRYRQEWNNQDMNFLVVMLPRYQKLLASSPTTDVEHPNAHSWAWMRESQLAAESLKNVSVVNTIDLGNPTNVHPKDKLPIGQRLAKLAARDTLQQDIEAQGPVLKNTRVSAGKITVNFTHSHGLTTTNGEDPSEFWLANDDQNWLRAKAKIIGNAVELSSDEISKPLYVRYAFSGAPNVNLINSAGLPAQPFRTDSFKP